VERVVWGFCRACWRSFLVLKESVAAGGRDYCFGGNFGFAGYLEGLKLKRRVWSTLMGSRFGEVGGGVKFENHVLSLFVFLSFLSVKIQQCPRF